MRVRADPPGGKPPCRCANLNPDAADARAGDFVSLDFFDDVRVLGAETAVEMVWVVDAATEETLRTCVLECSADGATWVSVRISRRRATSNNLYRAILQNIRECELACREILVEESQHPQPNAAHQAGTLRECIFTISVHAQTTTTDAPTSTGGVRAVRVRNMRDRASPWKVHQVSVRRPF